MKLIELGVYHDEDLDFVLSALNIDYEIWYNVLHDVKYPVEDAVREGIREPVRLRLLRWDA